MPSLRDNKKVHRVVILVAGSETEEFLEAPISASGSGRDEANVIYKVSREKNLLQKVKSMCSDTTASNTEPKKGACILLESMMQQSLYSLACCQHIHELTVAATFDLLRLDSRNQQAQK